MNSPAPKLQNLRFKFEFEGPLAPLWRFLARWRVMRFSISVVANSAPVAPL